MVRAKCVQIDWSGRRSVNEFSWTTQSKYGQYVRAIFHFMFQKKWNYPQQYAWGEAAVSLVRQAHYPRSNAQSACLSS